MSELKAAFEAEHELTRGDNAKDDMMMMMEPFNHMESQLSAAPMCISILGQLNLIATGQDFSLVPKDEFSFKKLDYPQSYRASLCQLSNEGYNAFLEADRVMDFIKLSTAQVPGHMKTSVDILMRGSNKDVEKRLPLSLKQIKQISDNCLKESETVVQKYEHVIEVIHEMQVASLAVQGETEKAKRMSEFQKEQMKKEKAFNEELRKKQDEECKQIQDKLDEANSDYKDALKKMPGAATMIFGSLTDTICNTVLPAAALAGGLGAMGAAMSTGEFLATGAGMVHLFNKNQESSNDQMEVDEGNEQRPRNKNISTVFLYSQADQILNFVKAMDPYFKDSGKSLDDEAVQKGTPLSADSLGMQMKAMVQNIDNKMRTLEDENDVNLAKKLKKICSDGEILAKNINETCLKSSSDSNLTQKYFANYQKLELEIRNIATIEKELRLNTPALKKNGPNLFKKIKSKLTGGTSKPSVTDNILRSTHTKLEVTREQMKSMEAEAREAKSRQLDISKNLQETLLKLSEFDANNATQKKVLEVLALALKAFGDLKAQWDKLMRFFQMMNNMIKTSLGPPMVNFVDYSKSIGDDRLDGEDISDYSKELIYKTAFEAVKVAYLVHNLSTSYCEVSQQHMMPLVSSLGQLIALNPETQERDIRANQRKLNENAKDMQASITRLIKERSDAYDHQLGKRIKEMEATFNSKVPIPPQIKEDIKSSVERTKMEVDRMDADDFC